MRKKMFFILPCLVIIVVIVISFLYFFNSQQSTNSQQQSTIHVTTKDSGSTIQMHSNQNLSLDLSLDSGLDHSIMISNPTLITQQSLQNNSSGTVHATLQAKNPGTATISVFGRPKCNPGAICPQFITQDLKLTIVILK